MQKFRALLCMEYDRRQWFSISKAQPVTTPPYRSSVRYSAVRGVTVLCGLTYYQVPLPYGIRLAVGDGAMQKFRAPLCGARYDGTPRPYGVRHTSMVLHKHSKHVQDTEAPCGILRC